LIDDPVANPVIQALSRIDSAIVLPSLSTLLEFFYELTNRNRTSLFSHLQQTVHTITDKIRASTIDFYNACDGLICTSHVDPSGAWRARLQLLSVVEEKNLFSGAEQELKSILSEKCRLTVDELCSRGSVNSPHVF